MPDPSGHPTDSGLLLIVSGPSGAGKTTIAHAIHEEFQGSVLSVSLTTRPQGPGEKDGVAYHFVTEDEFLRRASGPGPEGLGEFLEHAGVYGKRYGTLRAPVQRGLRDGRLVILEIDVQGAKLVKSQIPSAFSMFVLPPSEDALLDRLRARRRDAEDVIQRRMASARKEMEAAREPGLYDCFITNDDLPRAIREACDTVERQLLARGVPASRTGRE